MRYGENPHQHGVFYGNLGELFEHGMAGPFVFLVDVDAAMQIIAEFTETTFGIIKPPMYVVSPREQRLRNRGCSPGRRSWKAPSVACWWL